MSQKSNIIIDELISTINKLYETNNPLVTVIKNPKLLLEGLNDLKNMIEMDKIKISIVEQIKLLITNKARNNGVHENHMLHTVITGEAGVGKSTIARILAKIWISLDMVKQPSKKVEKDYTELLEKTLIEYDYKLTKINKGLEQHQELIKNMKTELTNIKHHHKNYDKMYKYIREAKFSNEKMIDIGLMNVQKDVEPNELKFTIASRDTLVAAFLGQTAIKTKAVLEKAAGGILLIDEAYSLYNSDRDSFGEECLSTINEFMSLRSDELIIIFAGYKDLLLNTIFKVQQGLHRRCMWFFEIENYSQDALASIFKKQLHNNGWKLDDKIDMNAILKKYKHVLKNPGSCEKTVFQCKIAYSEYHFDNTLENKVHDSIITYDMLISAIEKCVRNNPVIKIDSVPSHMYL